MKKESKLPLDKAMIIWFLNEYKYGSINRFDLFIKFRELFFSKKLEMKQLKFMEILIWNLLLKDSRMSISRKSLL